MRPCLKETLEQAADNTSQVARSRLLTSQVRINNYVSNNL